MILTEEIKKSILIAINNSKKKCEKDLKRFNKIDNEALFSRSEENMLRFESAYDFMHKLEVA